LADCRAAGAFVACCASTIMNVSCNIGHSRVRRRFWRQSLAERNCRHGHGTLRAAERVRTRARRMHTTEPRDLRSLSLAPLAGVTRMHTYARVGGERQRLGLLRTACTVIAKRRRLDPHRTYCTWRRRRVLPPPPPPHGWSRVGQR
jgi:hypothetical protein